jgi:hypothetical protein
MTGFSERLYTGLDAVTSVHFGVGTGPPEGGQYVRRCLAVAVTYVVSGFSRTVVSRP